MDKKVRPAAFIRHKGLKSKVYYVRFPEKWKRELFEIEQLKKGKSVEYNLPTSSLDRLLLSWLPGVVACNPVSKTKDNSKWLVSCEAVDHELLIDLIKVWIYGEYLESKKT